MKLLSKDDKSVTFLVRKRERELMTEILRRYPMVIAGHFRKRHPNAPNHANEDLIEEALAEQQKESRRQLEEMLSQPGRFGEDEKGFRFTLTLSELEWLLQVFNDVRVGSWIQLGEPDLTVSYLRPDQKLDEQTVQLAWAMEIAGHFQRNLLDAVSPSAS